MSILDKIRAIYLQLLASCCHVGLWLLNRGYRLLHKREPEPEPEYWMETRTEYGARRLYTCYACPVCGGVITSGQEHICADGAA